MSKVLVAINRGRPIPRTLEIVARKDTILCRRESRSDVAIYHSIIIPLSYKRRELKEKRN